MPELPGLSADELRACREQIRLKYEAFAKRGLKLNLTRGKPSSAQLDLSNELLAMPGRGDFMAGAVDTRNYGELQGLIELRSLLAPVAYAWAQVVKRRLPGQAAALIGAGGAEALMSHVILVSPRLVTAVQDAGGQLYVWTVDDSKKIAWLESIGVDGVITNDPRLFGEPSPA